ncbi:nucleoside phosphorylase [Rikenella microfusus]|uniref:Uridine phosphorylase n=1 Tax=Rikenella microfusus TaxID=28139 RepID=A0A379MT80_9BACT|nr:nucleoside phosphorylase [Rikenella microfusus]SUE33969.1 Uridine phosphorylase [Rikenella microfusus]HJE88749.1 nucleoside phosphorylase [Rikenella microfusus]
MRTIPSSELIVNDDGSVFHLHLKPDELADTVILVGDPDRSSMVASYFDRVEHSAANREFRCHTGTLNGVRLTVVSTGIGCDNIDIVMNELDALANVDFAARVVKPGPQRRSLRIVRLGTCGAVQPDIPLGALVMSAVSGGIDGLLNFYADSEAVRDLRLEEAFVRQTGWDERLARPYFVRNDAGLIELFGDVAIRGLTLSAPGFYAPQGRVVRLPLARPDYLEKIERFEHEDLRVTNLEMESSAIAGLAALLGHRALTVCTVIAQRTAGDSKPDYAAFVRNMVETALAKLTRNA